MIHFSKLGRSFGSAFRGLIFVMRWEQNMRIHTILGVGVLVAGVLLRISQTEWMILALCISGVLITETVNTCIEFLLDLVHPTLGERVLRIKDMMAASVVIASVTALVIGLMIFVPKLVNVGLSY